MFLLLCWQGKDVIGMKREIPREKPESIVSLWPGHLDMFSHIDYVAGVPQAIFLVTTVKPDGKINACLQSWTAFGGGGDGYYAVMAGLANWGHTYQNIMRDQEFCINFLSPKYYDACKKTIEVNDQDVDELEAAGLTAEPAAHVKPPRIKEAFLVYECRLTSDTPLANKGAARLIVGEVIHAAQDASHDTWKTACGESGFAYYAQAEGRDGGIAGLEALRDA